MNPDAQAQPQQSPPLPPADLSQKNNKTLIKILFGGFVGFINIGCLIVLGFVVSFFIAMASRPNPADILVIALVPFGAIALFVMSITDGIVCLLYLRSKNKSKHMTIAASIILAFCLVMLGLIVYGLITFLIWDFAK